jgi:phospholipid transport system substrate-binding protein
VTRLRRRALLAALALLPVAARAADLSAQAQPIAGLFDGLQANMKAGKSTPFATRAAKLGPIVEGSFDLQGILHASVGPKLAGFTPGQQAALFAAFRDYSVATWVANFDTDEGQRFEIVPGLRAVGADQVVQTRIVPTTGSPTRLDFVMHETPQGWRAVDVLVDGAISRTAVQRSDFRAFLKGSDPAPLISMLKDKAAALAK